MKWLMACFYAVLFLARPSAQPTPGTVDTNWNVGELETVVIYEYDLRKVIGLALAPDGGIFIGGHINIIGGVERNQFARLHPDGSVDLDFIPPATINPHQFKIDAHTIFPQNDGAVWAGFMPIHRFNETGNFKKFTPEVKWGGPVAVYPDGRVLLLVGELDATPVARFSADGQEDAGFERIPLREARDIWILSNGNLITASEPGMGPGGTSLWIRTLARRIEDGDLDPGFSTVRLSGPVEGSAAAPEVGSLSVAEAPGGKIYAAGFFTKVNGTDTGGLVRLNRDGTLDETFQPALEVLEHIDQWPVALAVQSNGKLLVGGKQPGGIARLNPDGSVDPAFQIGTGATDGREEDEWRVRVDNIVVQEDGGILISGDFTLFNGVPRDTIARLHGDPVTRLEFQPAFLSGELITWDITGHADRVVIEATDSLNTPLWTPISTNQMVDGKITFEQPAPDASMRFYRARTLPE